LKATIDLGVSVAHASIQSTSVDGELLLVSDRRTSSICAFHLGESPQKLSSCDAQQLQEVVCFNVDATAQWLVAGSIDGALAIWRLHGGGTATLVAP
jgi:6-phosphogluconolactonase (cycloisomerase 2 family)